MPLTALLKIVFGLLSLFILWAGGYLLWSWWDGMLIPAADGAGLIFVREVWRLWSGLALLAWSCLGRFVVTPLLARGDTDPTAPVREAGVEIAGDDGALLYVERRGEGAGLPLILTHGWGLDSTIWRYASRGLGQNHSVVVWDLPGLGRSKTRPSEITLPAFAASLIKVADYASERPVVLVGHSIGGMTIQTLVHEHPEWVRRRVAGVVLINTTYTNPLRTMVLSRFLLAIQKPLLEPLFHLMAWFQPLVWIGAWQSYLSGSAHIANRFGFGRYVTRSQLEHTTLLTTRNPPGIQARGNLAMLNWDSTEALATLEIPVLVLGGAVDIVTKAEASRKIATDAPMSSLEVIEGVNHMGFLERADAYDGAIMAFLDQVEADAIRPEGLRNLP